MKTITYRGIKIHQGETGCRFLMSNVPGITLDQAKRSIDQLVDGPQPIKIDKATAKVLLYALEAADDNDAFDNLTNLDKVRLNEAKSAISRIATR